MEQDQTLVCVEQGCGNEFTVSVSEQRFFTDKGLSLPKRCKSCRDRRRNQANSPFKGLKEQYNAREE